LIHSKSTLSPPAAQRSQTSIPGLDGQALDSDIVAQAEAIRKERLERRQKKANTEPKEKEETKVLVGNLIGEDHVNYVLMYNMLTGIRIGVSVTPLYPEMKLTNRSLGVKQRSDGH
jgi:1-phosphatidylinositol-4-phosphate 5-kinase